MAQWGNTDDAANSVLWAVSQLNKPANTDNQTALFGNTTPDGFISGRTDGQFGLDVTEIGVTNASVVAIELITPGSGYSANATVTVAGNATANALAGATGLVEPPGFWRPALGSGAPHRDLLSHQQRSAAPGS